MRITREYIWGLLRLSMGWIFLWPFFDKLFGLGFATAPEKAWVLGNSPTFGFLKFATKGPFAEFYQGLAGNAAVDWLFMLGLLFIGLALALGVMVRFAAFFGAVMLVLMYTAAFIPPEHNPFLDDHLIYALLMFALIFSDSGRRLGFGEWWCKLWVVKSFPILK